MPYKLLSMNLRYPSNQDGNNQWMYRYHAVAAFINQVKPLVFGTQEVLEFMSDDLLNLTPNYKAFGIPREKHGEGVLIFYDHTQLDLIEGGNFWLSETPEIPESKSWNTACIRMCTWAEFSFSDNRNLRFRFFNTHLDHVSLDAQINGIELILKKIESLNKKEMLPTFIVGDFNATFESKTINHINSRIKSHKLALKSVYKPGKTYGATFHAFTNSIEGEPIDYIYYSKMLKVKNFKIYREPIDGRCISDHYPIGLTFDFKQVNI